MKQKYKSKLKTFNNRLLMVSQIFQKRQQFIRMEKTLLKIYSYINSKTGTFKQDQCKKSLWV